jgi:hypothetical protein
MPTTIPRLSGASRRARLIAGAALLLRGVEPGRFAYRESYSLAPLAHPPGPIDETSCAKVSARSRAGRQHELR